MMDYQETPDERLQRIDERVANVEKSVSSIRSSLSGLIWMVAIIIIGLAIKGWMQ